MLSEQVSGRPSKKLSQPLNHFAAQPIHTVPVTSVRTLHIRFARDASRKSVEVLQAEISGLCSERQGLRAAGAEESELERNRVAIARLQWQLSHALIERYARHAAA
jgi:hypothetical protein